MEDRSSLSIEYKLKLRHNRRKQKPKPAPKPRLRKLPHVTRILALAHHLQDLVEKGTVKDYADIARLSNLTRARLSQIMNLTLLAPGIQEEILSFSKSSSINIREYDLREILKSTDWQEQYKVWKRMKSQATPPIVTE